jgi:hypothetical protein
MKSWIKGWTKRDRTNLAKSRSGPFGDGQPSPEIKRSNAVSIKADASHSISAVRGCLYATLTLVLLFAAGQAVAQQRTHQISWGHSAPSEVSRFVILVSPVQGTVPETREIDVGLPDAQVVGELSLYSAVVSFEADEFLAIAAVGLDGQISIPSNWGGMPPSRPGQPLLVEP